jgi:uncharacterized membrane protein
MKRGAVTGGRALLLGCGLAAAAGCAGPPATADQVAAGGDAAPATTSAAIEDTAAATVPPAAATVPGSAPAPAAAPAAPLQRLRGNAIMGKDGYGVTPCGETRQRIVDFDAGARALLDQFLAGGAHEFFLDGWAGPGPGDRLTVQRVERLYSEGPGCQEALSGVVFAARGNEPFWSLRAGQDGVRLERPGQAVVSAPFIAPEQADAGFNYAAQTRAGTLTVLVAPGTCSDGMSDTVYGWTATVTLGEQTYRGCGFAGLPVDRD